MKSCSYAIFFMETLIIFLFVFAVIDCQSQTVIGPSPLPPHLAALNTSDLSPVATLSPFLQQIDGLSAGTANFIQTLDHSQLQAFLQMMLTHQGHIPLQQLLSGNAANRPDLTVNVQVQGYGSISGSPGSPLMQLTLFKSANGKVVARMAEEIAGSKLGEYVGRLHNYWRTAAEPTKYQYRNDILRHIDSLNVPLGMKHAIQELLPGLALGELKV